MPRSLTNTRFAAIASSFALVLALLCPFTASADSKIRIMTATTDLASLAQEIGGDKVDVESIARGYQDPHFVDPKPSFLLNCPKPSCSSSSASNSRSAGCRRSSPSPAIRGFRSARLVILTPHDLQESWNSLPARSPAPKATSTPRAIPTTGSTRKMACALPRAFRRN